MKLPIRGKETGVQRVRAKLFLPKRIDVLVQIDVTACSPSIKRMAQLREPGFVIVQIVLLATKPAAHVKEAVPPFFGPQTDLVTQELVRMMLYKFAESRGQVILNNSAYLGENCRGGYPISDFHHEQVCPVPERCPQILVV